MKKSKGTFFDRLSQTRLIIDAYELLTREAVILLSHEELGIVVWLAMYFGHEAFPLDFKYLARLLRLSTRRLKRLWPALSRHLEQTAEGRYRFVDAEWLRLQTISAERQSLRHLLSTLVAYWGNACVYCGTDNGELQIEHIVPVVRGGTDDLTNLTLACGACNLKKRTQTAAEFGHPHIHDLASRIQ